MSVCVCVCVCVNAKSSSVSIPVVCELQIHLEAGGHGEVSSPTEVVDHPEFFKEHEMVEGTTTDAFPATTEPVAISNGQATCG